MDCVIIMAMKKIVVRIILMGASACLWWGMSQGVNWWELQTTRSEIVFTLPLPESIQEKYGLPPIPDDIDRVYVTGFFCNWASEPENFKLEKDSKGIWKTVLEWEGGRNQYKFVFFLKEGVEAFWTHTDGEDPLTDDFFGGYNNVKTIPEWTAVHQSIDTIFISIFFSLLLFTLMEPFIRSILAKKLSIRWKIFWILGPVVFFSGLFLTLLQIPRMQELARQSFVQEVHWLQSILEKRGIDFAALNKPSELAIFKKAMNDGFYNMATRGEGDKRIMPAIGLSQLYLFDSAGGYLGTYSRQQGVSFYEEGAKSLGYENLKDFSDKYIGGIVKKALDQNQGLLPRPVFLTSSMLLETWEEKIRVIFMGGDMLAVPLWYGGEIQAYYVFDIQNQLFGKAIENSLIQNILVLIPVFLLIGFLLFRTGRFLTSHLETLTGWTQRIVQGDLTPAALIHTGDELDTLSTNFDHMRGSLSVYHQQMEELVKDRTRELHEEREKSESLLLNILPYDIAQRLKTNHELIADGHESVAVLFADIVNFTPLASSSGAHALVQFLNDLFSKFDELVGKYTMEKIKTIGDAYMVAGGLSGGDPGHPQRMLSLAMEMIAAATSIKTPMGDSPHLRIGIHLGPVVAGVIGTRKFIYDLWGDTVNIASRMESHGTPDKIHVSDAFYQSLETPPLGKIQEEIALKGRGIMKTWLL